LFTGLIIEMGQVVSVIRKDSGARFSINAKAVSADAEIGDSIAVNGACLTVVEKNGDTLAFDLSDETLRASGLGNLRKGEKVNLEPSLKLNSKLGGHFVTGHIDGVGKIRSRTVTGEIYKFVIEAAGLSEYLVEKGSVAVDGISLTVVDVLKDGFSIVIIPHTAKMTTLGFKAAGDPVNIEVDILGKYVSKFLGKRKDSMFMNTLSEGGFV
jgi:riboflavin synthase